jgi:hypothetical protein
VAVQIKKFHTKVENFVKMITLTIKIDDLGKNRSQQIQQR